MADQQQPQRTQQVSFNDRPSTADRVRQIQDMQNQMHVQQTTQQTQQTQQAQPHVAQQAKVATGMPVQSKFDVKEVQRTSTELRADRPSHIEQTNYAKVQVDPSQLFGNPNELEVAGNPWKVIDFSPYLPAAFKTPQPLANYEPRVPEKAVETDHGLLFQVALKPKSGTGPSIERAVLTTAEGKLTGAECRSAEDLSHLLAHSPQVAQQIFASAFGDSFSGAGGELPKITNLAQGRRAAFEVKVERAGQSRMVQLNNFAQPIGPRADPTTANIILANYHLDRFDAAAH